MLPAPRLEVPNCPNTVKLEAQLLCLKQLKWLYEFVLAALDLLLMIFLTKEIPKQLNLFDKEKWWKDRFKSVLNGVFYCFALNIVPLLLVFYME